MVLAGPACLPGRVRQIDGVGDVKAIFRLEFIFKELKGAQSWSWLPSLWV